MTASACGDRVEGKRGEAVRDKVVKKLAELRAKYEALEPIRYAFSAEDAGMFDELREEIEYLENMVERSTRAPTNH